MPRGNEWSITLVYVDFSGGAYRTMKARDWDAAGHAHSGVSHLASIHDHVARPRTLFADASLTV